MRTDGQTDMMKLILTFRNFARAPKTTIAQNAECYGINFYFFVAKIVITRNDLCLLLV